MGAKYLCVSTASPRCTQAVKARLPREESAVVLRPTGSEPVGSLAGLARRSEVLIVVTGRGLRASQLLLATIRAAERTGRPCLYLQHEDGLADRLALPPRCEKRHYGTATEAAALVADFIARGPKQKTVHLKRRLLVFAIEDGPIQWNNVIAASLRRPGIQRIYTTDMRTNSILKAATEADVTIVLPSGRKRRWHRQSNRLMQLAIDASKAAGKRSLRIRHFQSAGSDCESTKCRNPAEVADAVDDFLDDAMTNVGLA